MKTVAQKIVARDNIDEKIRRNFLHLKIDDIDKFGEIRRRVWKFIEDKLVCLRITKINDLIN